MIHAGRFLLLLTAAATPTPSPSVSLGPCTGPHCPRSGGFWVVFVVLAGLLVIYRLWLLRRR